MPRAARVGNKELRPELRLYVSYVEPERVQGVLRVPTERGAVCNQHQNGVPETTTQLQSDVVDILPSVRESALLPGIP